MLTSELEIVLRNAGAKLVGFGDMSTVENCDYPCGVSVAIPVPINIINDLAHEGTTKEYYDMYYEYNKKLDTIVTAGADFLIKKGFATYAQTTKVVVKDDNWRTLIPHKTVATRAGLGWIGKSCLLVTPQYGSAIRISSLLTHAPLICRQPIDESRCGNCRVCEKSCPGKAINGVLWSINVDRDKIINKEKCKETQLRVMKQRTGINQDLCGKCFAVCPYTRRYVRENS